MEIGAGKSIPILYWLPNCRVLWKALNIARSLQESFFMQVYFGGYGCARTGLLGAATMVTPFGTVRYIPVRVLNWKNFWLKPSRGTGTIGMVLYDRMYYALGYAVHRHQVRANSAETFIAKIRHEEIWTCTRAAPYRYPARMGRARWKMN